MHNTDITTFSVEQKSTWHSLLSITSKRNSTTVSLMLFELKQEFQTFSLSQVKTNNFHCLLPNVQFSCISHLFSQTHSHIQYTEKNSIRYMSVQRLCSNVGNGAFRIRLILMVSALQFPISLFFGSAYRSWCGRHYLLDGDFSPDCSQKKMRRKWGEKKQARKKILCKQPQKI